jgi:hypothetical protein
MFEQEIEMEQRQSSVVPLLLIVAMILAFVGVAAYYVVQNGKVLPASEASSLIAQSLKSDGPTTIHFETGRVAATVQDRPYDPNYRLLEKAGFLRLGKDNGHFTPVELTPAGHKLLAAIPGVSQTTDAKSDCVLSRTSCGAQTNRHANRHEDGHGESDGRVRVGLGTKPDGGNFSTPPGRS